MGGKLFFKGIPTDPDVNTLAEAFAGITDERVIEYGEIEAALGISKKHNRFQSVLNAWRRKVERETGSIFITIPTVGIKIANSKERVNYSGRKVKSGTRAITRGAVVASKTNRSMLTDEEKRICDHLTKASSALAMSELVARKPIELPPNMQ